MTRLVTDLPAVDPNCECINVVVDTPKGSRNKYKFDENQGQLRLSKVLPQGSYFPFDFGFIPSTAADDGDPLDVLLLGEEPTFAGCVVPARLIGVVEAEQTEKGKTIRNDRLIAVIETPYNPPLYEAIDQVKGQVVEEVEHFFIAYNRAEGRDFKLLGRRGPESARDLLDKAVKRRSAK